MTHGKDLKDWQKLALAGQKLKACIFYSRENSGGIGTARPAVEKYIKETQRGLAYNDA